MKNIETLTAAERRDLVQLGDRRVCEKTLRIIDAQAAALAEARAECERLRAELRHAEDSERHLRESLRAAYDEVERLTEALPGGPKNPELAPELVDAAEAKLAAAEAECERLRELLDMCSNNFDAMVEERNRADVAESKIAASKALLERAACRMPEVDYPLWWEAYRAFLTSAQPAAPARSEAEQRVLDAVAARAEEK
jgi:DNA repair exonuclease SbcCD ATPase subunit